VVAAVCVGVVGTTVRAGVEVAACVEVVDAV
jgi:hypothetical protein